MWEVETGMRPKRAITQCARPSLHPNLQRITRTNTADAPGAGACPPELGGSLPSRFGGGGRTLAIARRAGDGCAACYPVVGEDGGMRTAELRGL